MFSRCLHCESVDGMIPRLMRAGEKIWRMMGRRQGAAQDTHRTGAPGLLPPGADLASNTQIRFNGTDLARLSEGELRAYRGRRIAMIFQDPLTSLNPVMKVGAQIAEAVRAHAKVNRTAARQRAIALLGEVGIADPEQRVDSYPHQLSGGMRQRVMIAIALAGEPDLLVADEPTTALDVTVQAQILELLDRLRIARGMAVLLITHDLGIVAGRADRVLVMYAGRLAETATTTALLWKAPYTHGLFASIRGGPRALRGGRGFRRFRSGTMLRPDQWPTGCRCNIRAHPVATTTRINPARRGRNQPLGRLLGGGEGVPLPLRPGRRGLVRQALPLGWGLSA